MEKITSWIAFGFTWLVMAGIASGAFAMDRDAAAKSPAGEARNFSLYVSARDGTRIAVDVWLPANLTPGERVPALIKGTPYWRARELSALGRAKAPELATEPDVPLLNARGYAVAAVDARGTGASFGTHQTLFSDAEVSDYGSVADWIVEQSWSNGKVGAYGFSYRGMTAANIASLPNREIKAVAPLFDLTDLYLLTHPGGVFAEYLLRTWGEQTRLLNSGVVPCNGDRACAAMIVGPKPVDADKHHVLLKQALAEHAKNFDVYRCTRAAVARDDEVCTSGTSLTRTSVLARKLKIEARGLPMFVLTGWLDEASPAQVLFRYETFSNPQEVIIGPFTHGGFMSDDPFFPDRPLDMSYRQQTELMADFFDRYLRDTVRPIRKSIRFYVNGAGVWQTTTAWPPQGTLVRRWYLEPSHGLAPNRPPAGADEYPVDFNATSGTLSGYRGQVDLSKTDYGNRATADARLLLYTSAPLQEDLEIIGNPVAHLRLASTATDGVVIVYLEDVAPGGRVTYITQGVLRLAFRTGISGVEASYSADPYHGYRRADMAPMRPGARQDVVIAISPIAALIRKGHALRVALAGADAVNLERIPARGDATLTVERRDSYVELPYRPAAP
jgi:uncharacterized protein